MNQYPKILADISKQHELTRLAVHPMVKRVEEVVQRHDALSQFYDRIQSPDFSSFTELSERLSSGPYAHALARHRETVDEINASVERMLEPYRETMEKVRLSPGFEALMNIGTAVSRLPPYSDDLATSLRGDLGDWRGSLDWPGDIFTNLDARTDFYRDLGFDRELTSGSLEDSKEGLRCSGLQIPEPHLLDLHTPPLPLADDEETEEAFERTNEAHNWLMRLESELRAFVVRQMEHFYGPNWVETQVPRDILVKWKTKKHRTEKGGAVSRSLIHYADFTDYEKLIVKKDNWRNVFHPYFNRPESVQESFDRLHPIRLDTMHARTITEYDKLLLYVEATRLLHSIR
ncbi:Swt1 family HEPN domain-containing protein [Fodinicurvata halophila]|uniref:Swt1 family HEPN domain-containing protein n=1 Tax=Fodinicurvata halophila TaxID=1419723 RepID=A0ABV8ULU4_9PROT